MIVHVDLFSGICGFPLAAKNTWGPALKTMAFCEMSTPCQRLINKYWEDANICPDIRMMSDFIRGPALNGIPINIMSGGDPCQSRSAAKRRKHSKHPDLSGYFLALVGRHAPQWVVRENVCASDVTDFQFGLELLGYTTAIIQLNARDFTSQNRRRQIIVGSIGDGAAKIKENILEQKGYIGTSHRSDKARDWWTHGRCLLAKWSSVDHTENYCYEHGKGIRYLTCEERERLQGFPTGWTAGFPKTTRSRMIGNAVPVPMAEYVFQQIKRVGV